MTIDDELDKIFDKVDMLCTDGKFEELDALIQDVEPRAIGTDLTVGWLTITRAAAHKLKNRDAMVERARQFFMDVAPHSVADLLNGLESPDPIEIEWFGDD